MITLARRCALAAKGQGADGQAAAVQVERLDVKKMYGGGPPDAGKGPGGGAIEACERFGSPLHRSIALLDHKTPEKGVAVEFSEGEACADGPGGKSVSRIEVHCDPTADPFNALRVTDYKPCQISLRMESVAGCPVRHAGSAAAAATAAGSCAANCDRSRLGDGVCDPGCNTLGCIFDGGDCYDWRLARAANASLRCAAGCPAAWLRDGTCQDACNTESCWHDGGDCKANSAAAARSPLDLLASFASAKGLAPDALYGVAPEPKHPGLGAAGRGLETLNYSYEAPAPVVQEQSADAAVRRATARSLRKGVGA
jgi:hypothetical protein